MSELPRDQRKYFRHKTAPKNKTKVKLLSYDVRKKKNRVKIND